MSTTLAAISHQSMPSSLLLRRLAARAGARPLLDWLVEQANLRGFHGAWQAHPTADLDPSLDLETIVVALCAPRLPADARVFKLVLRVLQSGRVDEARLARLARMERADPVLWWLLERTPAEERNEAVDRVAAALHAPRGYRGLDFDYDARRLLRRPFDPKSRWPTRRS